MENDAGGAFCLQVDIGRENVMFDMQKVGGHIAALRKKGGANGAPGATRPTAVR